jgi:hypothetical protein
MARLELKSLAAKLEKALRLLSGVEARFSELGTLRMVEPRLKDRGSARRLALMLEDVATGDDWIGSGRASISWASL